MEEGGLVPPAVIMLMLVLHETAERGEHEVLISRRHHDAARCLAGSSGFDIAVFCASRSWASVNGFWRHCVCDSTIRPSARSGARPVMPSRRTEGQRDCTIAASCRPIRPGIMMSVRRRSMVTVSWVRISSASRPLAAEIAR
jgi:hypothetical protein